MQHIHPSFLIADAAIGECITALIELRARPEADSREYLEALKAFAKIEGRDTLADEIERIEAELSPSECLVCERPVCGCDARYEEGREL